MRLSDFLNSGMSGMPPFRPYDRPQVPEGTRQPDKSDMTAMAVHDGILTCELSPTLKTSMKDQLAKLQRKGVEVDKYFEDSDRVWRDRQKTQILNGGIVLQQAIGSNHCEMADRVLRTNQDGKVGSVDRDAGKYVTNRDKRIMSSRWASAGDSDRLKQVEYQEFGRIARRLTHLYDVTGMTDEAFCEEMEKATPGLEPRPAQPFEYKATHKSGITDLAYIEETFQGGKRGYRPRIHIEVKLPSVCSTAAMCELETQLRRGAVSMYLVQHDRVIDRAGTTASDRKIVSALQDHWNSIVAQVFSSMMYNRVRWTMVTNGKASQIFHYGDNRRMQVSEVLDHDNEDDMSLVGALTVLPVVALKDDLENFPKSTI